MKRRERREFRDFMKRLNDVKDYIKSNDPDRYEEFSTLVTMLSPEIPFGLYGDWINSKYGFDHEDDFVVDIHSLYLGMPKERIRNILADHNKYTTKKLVKERY